MPNGRKHLPTWHSKLFRRCVLIIFAQSMKKQFTPWFICLYVEIIHEFWPVECPRTGGTCFGQWNVHVQADKPLIII